MNSSLRESPLVPGVLLGVGIMAAVDEIIFHQLLGWHHFYDRATPFIGLLSDGLLHAGELLALVGGFFLLFEQRQMQRANSVKTWAGFFLGAGGFQLFDGLINHKILKLHQIRYGVELLPYDVIWNTAAIALVLMGILLLRNERRRGR
jgi:uncharacterized membrane protein